MVCSLKGWSIAKLFVKYTNNLVRYFTSEKILGKFSEYLNKCDIKDTDRFKKISNLFKIGFK